MLKPSLWFGFNLGMILSFLIITSSCVTTKVKKITSYENYLSKNIYAWHEPESQGVQVDTFFVLLEEEILAKREPFKVKSYPQYSGIILSRFNHKVMVKDCPIPIEIYDFLEGQNTGESKLLSAISNYRSMITGGYKLEHQTKTDEWKFYWYDVRGETVESKKEKTNIKAVTETPLGFETVKFMLDETEYKLVISRYHTEAKRRKDMEGAGLVAGFLRNNQSTYLVRGTIDKDVISLVGYQYDYAFSSVGKPSVSATIDLKEMSGQQMLL